MVSCRRLLDCLNEFHGIGGDENCLRTAVDRAPHPPPVVGRRGRQTATRVPIRHGFCRARSFRLFRRHSTRAVYATR